MNKIDKLGWPRRLCHKARERAAKDECEEKWRWDHAQTVTSHEWSPCLKILDKNLKGSNSIETLLSRVNWHTKTRFLIKKEHGEHYLMREEDLV